MLLLPSLILGGVLTAAALPEPVSSDANLELPYDFHSTGQLPVKPDYNDPRILENDHAPHFPHPHRPKETKTIFQVLNDNPK